MTYTFQEMMLSASVAVYVAICAVVAVVRLGHKCSVYSKHMDYYFPAWKTMAYCFLSNLVLAPVVFFPAETDAILQLRMMLILSSPFLCAVLIFSYFGRVLKVLWWRRPIIVLSVSYSVMSAIGWVSTLIPGTQMQGTFLNVYFWIGGVLALIYLASFVLALRLIIRELHRFSDENYSNPDDFPEQYTISILWITILHLIMSWAMAINGAMWALSFGLVVLSILSVVILLGALNPHRTAEVEQLEAALNDEKEEDKSLESDILPPERKEEILRAIRRQVESEKAFLDSHLTLSKLSRDCGLNRTYISVVLNESLGGFFNYINRCRLTHADTYKESHPKADVDEIALASGFNNRQSFYNARKRLNG